MSNQFPPKCNPLCKKKPYSIVDMPIYSPTGFLDITNATLRTSNTECQNLKIGTGNLYVTSEISPDFELNLSNVTNLGATSPHTLTLSNVTTAIDATSNIITSGNLKIGGLIYTKDWGFRTANGSTGNQYVGRFTALGITEVLITDQGGSLGSSSKYTITRNINSIPLVNGIDSSSTVNYEWYYSPVPGGSIYDLWVRPIYSSSVQTNIKVTSSTYTEVAEPTSVTLIPCVNGLITMSGNVVANQNLTVSGNTFYTSPVSINVDSNVVTEYTGPHDRPQRKYPEIILPRSAVGAEYNGYRIDRSSEHVTVPYDGVQDLFNETAVDYADTWGAGWQGTSGAYSTSTGEHTTFVTGGTTQGTGANLSSSSGVPNGEWVSLKSPNAIKLDNIQIRSRNATDWYAQFPTDFQIWGSNNGTTWSHVKTFTGQAASGQSVLHTYTVNSTIFYNRHALVVTKIPGTASTIVVSTGHAHFSISELRFNAKEEGSASLDTTLKTVYNVPATTGAQLDVYYDGQDYGPSVPTSITDKTGNGNNTTTVGSGIGFDSTYKAFTFDGTSNGKIVGTHDFSGDASPVLTMSFWMKRTAVMGSYDYIATIGTAATGQMIGLTTNPNNQFNFGNYGDGVITDESILLDQWYHVTLVANGEATFNSTNFKPYINGKEPKLSSYGGDSTTTLTGTQLTLGTNTNSAEAFNGSIANFRLYSKALNAEQIQELYDYQKDYFLGSKSQVTLYKGHLGVGVTEPSGQLELAGDERIQMYPPRDLDQYDTNIEGHGVFCVSASNEYWDGNHPAWEAFSDNHINTSDESVWTTDDLYDASTGLHDGSTTTAGIKGEWIQLKTPYKIKISSFDLNSYIDSASNRQPRDFILLGSNDGNVWEQMKSVAGQTSGYTMPGPWNTSPAGPHHIVNSTKYYSYFRIVVTANQGDNLVGISRIRFYGTPGPTTLDKGSLTLGRSLDVPRISRYDVDTETPRPEKLLVDFDTTVNSSPTDISGKGNHGTFNGDADYSAADKAFDFPNDGATGSENVKITAVSPISASTDIDHSFSIWVKVDTASTSAWRCIWEMGDRNYYKHFGLYIPGPSATVARGRHQFSFETWGQGYYPSGETVEANRWYHIVGTYDKDTRTKALYIDGVYKNGGAITTGAYSSGPANPPLTIGSHLTGGETWAGQVSSFKAYKGVTLEPSEVRKLYNLGRTGRSMVISDTAVGIGKAPEANLDVRGVAKFRGAIGYGNQPSTANDGNDYPDIFPASPLHIHQSTHPGQVEDEGIRFSHPANIGRWNLYISNNNHFRFAYNGGFKGWVDQSDSNAQMNGNFTGQHRTFIKDVPFSRVSDLEGLIVSSDQNKYIKMSGGIETGSNAITTNESLPVVSLSNVVTDKRCFGVISASEDPDERTEQYGVFGSNFKKEKGDTRVYINSVGEGAIWVVNTIGSLEAGDYITTSNVAGYGQKQDDDVLHNYTVAKITMDCDFNPATQPIQVIRKDDNGDNVLDEHDQIQWEDHPTETEKAYKLRYLDANGNTTDEASAVHIAAFVGCTYHCG